MDLSIKSKLLLTLGGLTILSVLTIALISIYSIISTGNNAKTQSSLTLNAQIEEFLTNLITVSAEKIELELNTVIKETELISNFAHKVFNEPSKFPGSRYWKASENLTTGPGGEILIKKENSSGIFIPNYVTINQDLMIELEQWSLLETILTPIYENNPITVNYWIISETEIFYYHPHEGIEITRPDFSPTKELMYTPAIPENNPELKTIWSPLYMDATGIGLMISSMTPIVKESNQLMGVLGFDVTLDRLTSKLEKDSPIADGYFILINDVGRALALPDKGYLDILGRTRNVDEFGPNLSETSSSFSESIASMTQNQSGFQRVKTDSNNFYVVYKPIANTHWSLGYVVESNQLTKIVTDLGNTLDSSTQSLILKRILPAGVFILLLTILVGMRMTNKIVNPIQKLSRVAIKLGQGNWDQQMPATKNDEIGILSKAFSKMASQLRQMMEGLEIRVAERTKDLEEANKLVKISEQRLQNELNVARDIQMSMLPLLFPAFPRRSDVDIYAELIPAREVGGDFYDFYFIDDNHLCFVIGDVSGKGAPAALMMAVCITLIKSNAKEDMSTASILTQVNNEMARNNVNAMFVTVFIGILNTTTGELIYTNAGHNPTFIKRVDGSLTKLTELHGVAIAAMEDLSYKEASVSLKQGDAIFAYTDGIPESHNVKDEMYSDEKLHDMLLEHNFVSAKKITEEVIKSVADFEKGGEQFDDVTALCIEFHGSDEQTLKRELIDIDNNLEEVSRVIEKFEAFAEKAKLPLKIAMKMNIVFDELLSNIIRFAFDDDRQHTIHIDIKMNRNNLIIIIEDDGVPFNPFQQNTPDMKLSIEEREIGGLGIHLVKNLMDECNYSRHTNKNTLTLVKYNVINNE